MSGPVAAPPGFQPGYQFDPWEEMMKIRMQFQNEMTSMMTSVKTLQEENIRLKIQLMEEREPKYATPPDIDPERSAHVRDGRKPKKLEDSKKTQDTSFERRHRKQMDKEDGPRGRQVLGRKKTKEDGAESQQDSMKAKQKEEGAVAQQDRSRKDYEEERLNERSEHRKSSVY